MQANKKTHLLRAHQLWSNHLRKGDLTVDATCGNGHDTKVLARLVGPSGRVIACDLQLAALASSQSRCPEPWIEWHLGCHSQLEKYLRGRHPQLVVYNLGYLPGGDKRLTTRVETTLQSVERALELGATVSIVCYPHEEGVREREALLKRGYTPLDERLFWIRRASAIK